MRTTSDRFSDSSVESLLGYSQRLKQADRMRLAMLAPEQAQAQAQAQAVFDPKLWRIVDPAQLEWPGDLADDDESLWFDSESDCRENKS